MPNTDIIREARELCERATPGPWHNFGGWMVHTESDADNRGILPEQTIGTVRAQNAAFIARSRTIIPELLDLLAAKDAEIARLTAERTAMIKALQRADLDCDTCKHNVIGDCEDVDFDCKNCAQDCPCKLCDGTSKWEWREATDN